MTTQQPTAPLSARLINVAGASVAFAAMTVGAHIAITGIRNLQAADAMDAFVVVAAFWFTTAVWWLTAVCWAAGALTEPPAARPPAPPRYQPAHAAPTIHAVEQHRGAA